MLQSTYIYTYAVPADTTVSFISPELALAVSGGIDAAGGGEQSSSQSLIAPTLAATWAVSSNLRPRPIIVPRAAVTRARRGKLIVGRAQAYRPI